MKTLSVREMRAALPTLEKLLESEGEVVITRNGRPVARLTAIAPRDPMPSHDDLRRQMRPLTVGSEHYIRLDRDER